MSILNVTPDSFSDGGLHFTTENAVAFAKALFEEGADIIDVGGESTRPGADPVSEEEEARRVFPVIEELATNNIPVSIDTSKPKIASEAIRLGASVINGITGLRNPEMLAVVTQTGAIVCIMHMLGEPRTMQEEPKYDDVVSEVKNYLLAKAQEAIDAGALPDQIWLDPGIGFGKTVEHNIALLQNLETLTELGFPVLIGASRKSFLGKITGEQDTSKRLGSSIAAALFAVQKGARIVRVHDVKPTVEALKTLQTLNSSNK